MTQTALKTCTYWSLTPEERAQVNASAPDKDAWDFHITRNATGLWQFDLPEYKTYGELLLNGTELVIDHMYTEVSDCIPDEWSAMDMTVSRIPLRHATTSLTFLEKDPFDPSASFYTDDKTGMKLWLCGFLTGLLWNPAPEKLYVNLTLVS